MVIARDNCRATMTRRATIAMARSAAWQFHLQAVQESLSETYKITLLQCHELGHALVLGDVLVVFEDAGAVDGAL